ncbi:hypothetical protein FJR45_10205 [Sulfurimonas sediminis]|uniref:Uncharacterized protein n=1 Tax=Sulfurimonas sediminis TaxID=2590020 RepID=A0A7M1B3I3_9BACT|nr:hypothetical protein [Sulfurimonas sediminis]QOP44293.1 hypothetical protein FJR45_10205 [Sulfurimonas sediminis]
MQKENNDIEIKIHASSIAKTILYYFISIEIIFLVLDVIINYNKFINYGPIRRLFNIAREDSLSSWFMTAQTLLTALTLWLILFLYTHHQKINKFVKTGWIILGSFFTYLAADDGALIHERLGSTFKLIATDQNNENSFIHTMFSFFPSYSWQIILLPIFIFIGVFMLVFLWKIFGRSKMMLTIVLAFSFLTTAVLLDFIEGLDKKSTFNLYYFIINHYNLENYTVQHFAKAIEELFEMFGMTLFLYTFLSYLSTVSKRSIKIM